MVPVVCKIEDKPFNFTQYCFSEKTLDVKNLGCY